MLLAGVQGKGAKPDVTVVLLNQLHDVPPAAQAHDAYWLVLLVNDLEVEGRSCTQERCIASSCSRGSCMVDFERVGYPKKFPLSCPWGQLCQRTRRARLFPHSSQCRIYSIAPSQSRCMT